MSPPIDRLYRLALAVLLPIAIIMLVILGYLPPCTASRPARHGVDVSAAGAA